MMKRHVFVAAFALLATMPILTFTAVSYRNTAPGRFGFGLVVLLLAAGLTVCLGWRAQSQNQALRAELESERQRKLRFEAHSRELYQELEHKLEERTGQLLQERDTAIRTEKLTALSRLVGGLAHELNNPLMAIMGEATLMRSRCGTPELTRGLQVIEQQAGRCAGLVRNLMAFASDEQNKVQPLDTQALVEGALAQAGMFAPGQEVEVIRQYWHEPLVITGNMEQLQQALSNVIGNAYQALTRATAGQLTLRSSRTEQGWIRLEIADNGEGIAREALPYIFDPFYSRPQLRPGAHTGLGLSVALGLVRSHGGRIWAESEVDKGTTVFIELPETK